MGPRHWAVRMDLRFREVAGIVWLGILFTRVDVSALCSMVGTDDGVGNGLRVLRGDPKTDGIPVEDLVEDCGDYEGVGTRVEYRVLEGLRGIRGPDDGSNKRDHGAPSPKMFCAGFAAAAEGAREIRARWENKWIPARSNLLLPGVESFRYYSRGKCGPCAPLCPAAKTVGAPGYALGIGVSCCPDVGPWVVADAAYMGAPVVIGPPPGVTR